MYPKKPDPKINERYGKLTVVEEIEKSSDSTKHLFKVKCDCGKEKIVSKFELCSSGLKSCGCLRLEKIRKHHHDCNIEKLSNIGDKFGKLTILKFNNIDNKKREITVDCRCECGTIKTYNYNSLLNGSVLSCGCLQRERTSKARKKEIPIGSRFGRLVVLKEERLPNEPGRLSYLCQCDCGKTKVVRAKLLLCGQTSSCGCLAIDKRREAQNKKAMLSDPKPGDKFGMITVLEVLPIGQKEFNRGDRSVKCKCDCGNIFVARKQSLLNGQKSCGCYKLETLLYSHIEAAKESRMYPYNMREFLCEEDKILFDKKELTGSSVVTFICKKCKKPFKIELGRVCYLKTGEQIRDYVCSRCLGSVSFQEESVYEYLLSIGVSDSEIKRHDRIVLNNKKELDFYVSSKNIAIEYNGSFWHSELKGKSKNYHKQKFETCYKKNISLLNIFDFYWLNNQDVIKDIIAKRFCLLQNCFRYNDCIIKPVTSDIALEFYKQNSIIIDESTLILNTCSHFVIKNKEDNLFCLSYLHNVDSVCIEKFSFKIGFYCDNVIDYIVKQNVFNDVKLIKVTLNNDIDDISLFIHSGFVIKQKIDPVCFYVLNNELLSLSDIDVERILEKFPALKEKCRSIPDENLKDFLLTSLGVNKVYNSGKTMLVKEC